MKKILPSLSFLLIVLVYFPVLNVHAETIATGLAQLSQCVGVDCSACNVVHLANGLIKWLIGFCFLLFAILLVVAGVRMVISGGSSQALEEAKGSFVNAIIGLIIILSAWLIVDTVMRTLVGTPGHEGQLIRGGSASGYLFWSQVSCQKQDTPRKNDQITIDYKIETYLDGSTINEAGMPSPSSITPIGSTPAVISGELVTYAGARFDSGVVSNVQYVATTFGLRVSGGYRTAERNREVGGVANSNHLTGRAADFVGTQAQMQAAQQWAKNNGAREALIHNAGSGTHLHLSW